MKFYSSAVIPAAGSGSRMGGVSKPNIILSGKTLFEYVLSAFCDSEVDEIVVACSEDNIDSLREIASYFDKKPIKFVLGGASRARSVENGINECDSRSSVICVHDCARPFITSKIINQTLESAYKNGASCVCCNITDTIKQKSASGFVSTPDRNTLFAVQTPQAFKKSLYSFAVNAVGNSLDNFTDETSLLEEIGVQVDYIVNNETNMKLTGRDDIQIAELLMNRRVNEQ